MTQWEKMLQREFQVWNGLAMINILWEYLCINNRGQDRTVCNRSLLATNIIFSVGVVKEHAGLKKIYFYK